MKFSSFDFRTLFCFYKPAWKNWVVPNEAFDEEVPRKCFRRKLWRQTVSRGKHKSSLLSCPWRIDSFDWMELTYAVIVSQTTLRKINYGMGYGQEHLKHSNTVVLAFRVYSSALLRIILWLHALIIHSTADIEKHGPLYMLAAVPIPKI